MKISHSSSRAYHERFYQEHCHTPRLLEIDGWYNRLYDIANTSCTLREVCKPVLLDIRFRLWPASQSVRESVGRSTTYSPGKHHFRIGGLLQHTLQMAEHLLLQRRMLQDPTVAIASCIWHDVGKLAAYDVPGYLPNQMRSMHEHATGCGFVGPIVATPEGKLLPHIPMGLIYIGEHMPLFVEELGPERAANLAHNVAAHHGFKNWGSPVTPKTMDAMLLHQADVVSVMLDGGGNPADRE